MYARVWHGLQLRSSPMRLRGARARAILRTRASRRSPGIATPAGAPARSVPAGDHCASYLGRRATERAHPRPRSSGPVVGGGVVDRVIQAARELVPEAATRPRSGARQRHCRPDSARVQRARAPCAPRRINRRTRPSRRALPRGSTFQIALARASAAARASRSRRRSLPCARTIGVCEPHALRAAPPAPAAQPVRPLVLGRHRGSGKKIPQQLSWPDRIP